MASSNNHLSSIGVKVYQRVEDVPYVRDDSWGSFRGSYGTVYRATRRFTKSLIGQGGVYAIKEIQALSAKDQLNVAREISLLRQLQHENILELEEAFIIDLPGHRVLNTIRLVTKPWAPVSLHHFIQDLANSSGHSTTCPWFKPRELGPWPSIVRQCLSGLEYLHSQRPNPIRHKDIKPHNILLSFESQISERPGVRPIIIDFGISKEHIDGATTANMGTYEYKAPEQIKKQSPTLASDVFSLGCCFTLIEGVLRPWPGLLAVYNAAMDTDTCQFANNTTFVNSVLQDLYKASARLDSPDLGYFCTRFRDLVRQMLEKEPTGRPSAALALDIAKKLDSNLTHFLKPPTLVEVDQKQGQWKDAKLLEVQVIEQKRILGVEHLDTITSMANLATIYGNQGRWKETETLELEVMEKLKRVLGEEHPDTLTSIANLASTYWNQGRWVEAESLWLQVMETNSRVLGSEHPSTLTSMNNLALTYWNQSRWVEAEKLLIQVMETNSRVLGSEHPSTLTSMNNLALTYGRQGRWAEAESLEVQVMEMRKKVLGLEHPDTLASMNNLAFTWKNQGRLDDALGLMRQSVQLRQKVLGPDHPHTQSSLSTLHGWQEGSSL